MAEKYSTVPTTPSVPPAAGRLHGFPLGAGRHCSLLSTAGFSPTTVRYRRSHAGFCGRTVFISGAQTPRAWGRWVTWQVQVSSVRKLPHWCSARPHRLLPTAVWRRVGDPASPPLSSAPGCRLLPAFAFLMGVSRAHCGLICASRMARDVGPLPTGCAPRARPPR